MFALISYPALFEPSFTTHQQSGMWSWSYGVFVVVCAFTAFKSNQAAAKATGEWKEARRQAPAAAGSAHLARPT